MVGSIGVLVGQLMEGKRDGLVVGIGLGNREGVAEGEGEGELGSSEGR